MIGSLSMILSASTTGICVPFPKEQITAPTTSTLKGDISNKLTMGTFLFSLDNYQELHLTSGPNHVNLRRVKPKCRIIFLLATSK
jgi:hypothetical protein